jgi:hypothetical protein
MEEGELELRILIFKLIELHSSCANQELTGKTVGWLQWGHFSKDLFPEAFSAEFDS